MRRRIRSAWETAGRPPCPFCRREIRDDEKTYASQLCDTVIHALCNPGLGAMGHAPEECTRPDDFCRIPAYCPCPLSSAVNMIIAAHSAGLTVVEVPTFASPGAQRAAEEVGLGSCRKGTVREMVERTANGLPRVIIEAYAEQEVRWRQPPRWLLVDVPGSIREGRIVAVRP